MIAWVTQVCEQWGRDHRRIVLGGRWTHAGEGMEWHWDGFPSRSMSDKIFREHFAAMCGVVEQHYPETMGPEAWHVHRVYAEFDTRRRTMMVGKYVARVPWKTVAIAAGYVGKKGQIAKDRYYDDWNRIHTQIDCEPRERLPEFIRELTRSAMVR
jgi:hypothetical protein